MDRHARERVQNEDRFFSYQFLDRRFILCLCRHRRCPRFGVCIYIYSRKFCGSPIVAVLFCPVSPCAQCDIFFEPYVCCRYISKRRHCHYNIISKTIGHKMHFTHRKTFGSAASIPCSLLLFVSVKTIFNL